MSRVLKERYNQITYGYKNRVHDGIDVVGKGYTLDSIVSHSDGQVVAVRRDYRTSDRTGNSYGNYVKIKHDNGYYTLYAHLKYGSVCVSVGDKVSRGQVIGYMGATGHVTGAHLHFEVRNENDVRIDPTNYIDLDLPIKEESKPQPMQPKPEQPKQESFKVGDIVVPTKLVDYNGTHLKQYDESYNITQINGDRAVLSARGQIWAAMNIKNIKHKG